MSFQRTSSKVWWASDDSGDWTQRSTSASPRSQDSGFSDTEASPNVAKTTPTKNRQPDITKKSDQNEQNYLTNLKEKSTPSKKTFNGKITVDNCQLSTPMRNMELEVRSEPANRFKFIKHSPKVTRTLFRSITTAQSSSPTGWRRRLDNNNSESNQYAKKTNVCEPTISSEVTYDDVDSSWTSAEEANVTVPLLNGQKRIDFNISAPAVLTEAHEETITSLNSLSPIQSDTDSELECLFAGTGDSPKHTSTPKVFSRSASARSKKKAMNLLLKYHNERVPPIHQNIEDGTACKAWFDEIRHLYDTECMTTLQSKSIAADLAEKVSYLASITTSPLTNLLYDIRIIEGEFENLKSQSKHKDSLIQSTTGLIKEFLQKYKVSNSKNIKKYCEELRNFKLEDSITKLQKSFTHQSGSLLETEVMKFAENIEDAESEMDLRAKVTGLTWICQRNPNVLQILVDGSVIQNLVILCEKCDGSSVRALILRALTTVCCNSSGIRQFERSSGVQLISDIIYEKSRPEPEKSEGIALLAQITAPWIEDNNKISGLQEHCKKLVSALTDFLQSTNCCQNLLLSAAALANLTTMEPKSIKYILHQHTVKLLLDAVRKRGPMASIFLLEQVAMLIANVSSLELARKQLANDEVPKVLICFLQADHCKEEVLKRLQQRSIIALSRLCGEPEAASQVVEIGGVAKLVQLCREKSARYNSDAVLVATLATLRRIAEGCGTSVIDTQDVQELVEPRLLDSFLAYSAQNESLV